MTPSTVIRAAFERDGLADDRRIGAESAAPEAVAEDRDLMLAVDFVLRRERAAEDRLLAQHGEERCGDALRAHLLGLGARLAQRERAAGDGGDRTRRPAAAPPVDVVLRREAADRLRIGRRAAPAGRSVARPLADSDQPVVLVERQPAQDDGVDDREDRRARADAERQDRSERRP